MNEFDRREIQANLRAQRKDMLMRREALMDMQKHHTGAAKKDIGKKLFALNHEIKQINAEIKNNRNPHIIFYELCEKSLPEDAFAKLKQESDRIVKSGAEVKKCPGIDLYRGKDIDILTNYNREIAERDNFKRQVAVFKRGCGDLIMKMNAHLSPNDAKQVNFIYDFLREQIN